MLVGGLAAATLALVAGCSGSNAAGGHSGDPSAQVRAPKQRLTVVGAASASATSVAVSRALFASAPVVVVARSGDRAAVTAGASDARQHHAPLLLTPPPTRSPAAAKPTAPIPRAVRAELRRLAPHSVLAVGRLTDALHRALPGTEVTARPGKLPHTGRPAGLTGLTVLVSAAHHDEGARAAAATAKIAGASVVPVHGHDPRADPRAISALARHQPRRVLAVGRGFGPAKRLEARLAVAETGTQLPGGGQVMFPGRRLVALYGHPGSSALGVLGEQGLSASINRAEKVAAPYRKLSHVPVVPTFEILATVASGEPGKDGDYSTESSVRSLRPWVKRAGAHGMYVVLDLQPGRANLLDQAKLYRSLLTLPYVGLALDAEWKLQPGQQPLAQIGHVDAPEVNSVIRWLAKLTASHHLPQKLLVLHQFRLSMLRDEQDIDVSHDTLSILIHMDGNGTPALKQSTWDKVVQAAPKGVWFGFKNFYDEDHPTLTPRQTLAHKPTPVMISYQ